MVLALVSKKREAKMAKKFHRGQPPATRVAARLRKLRIEARGNDGHKVLTQKVLSVRPELKGLGTQALFARFILSVPYGRTARQLDAFYNSQGWRQLRYQALKIHGGRCMLCNRGRKDGVQMHVDHIKPRAKFPELALVLDNLQVLCRDCNLGKRHLDETDWR